MNKFPGLVINNPNNSNKMNIEGFTDDQRKAYNELITFIDTPFNEIWISYGGDKFFITAFSLYPLIPPKMEKLSDCCHIKATDFLLLLSRPHKTSAVPLPVPVKSAFSHVEPFHIPDLADTRGQIPDLWKHDMS